MDSYSDLEVNLKKNDFFCVISLTHGTPINFNY